MFDNIAPTYDGLNHILSLNIDRLWRRRVVRIVRRTGAKRIMDMATGTGDLAVALAKHIDGSHILGVDLSEKMLDVAREKIRRQGLDERIVLQQGDAEQLDDMAAGSLDAVTVAFGVRNFENLAAGLQQLCRTIRPRGTLVVLEFSTPRNRVVRCTSAGMNLYVRIGNTSSYNVILKSCTAVIRCGGEELMQIELRERAVIPKRSTSEVLLPLRFRADNSMSIAVLLRRILQGRIDDMTVTMTAKCRASIISKTFSMQNVAMSEILDNFGVTIDNVKRLSELL